MLGFEPQASAPLAALLAEVFAPAPTPGPSLNISGVFKRQIQQAIKLVAKYGEQCTSYTSIAVTPDTDAPWANADDNSNVYSGVFVLWDWPNLRAYLPVEVSMNIDAQVGSKYGYMAQQVFTPKLGDILVRSNGERWTVEGADPVDPNGITILTKVTFRQ